MRKILGSLVVLLLIVVVVGVFRGWFGVPSGGYSPDDKRATFSVDVDKEKIKEDAEAVKDKAGKITDKIKDSTK